MDLPITQSNAWKKLQDDLNETSFFETNNIFTYLAILKKTPFGNYLYLPYGPFASSKTAFKKALEAVLSLAKEQSAIFIRVEPLNPSYREILANYRLKKSHDLNPADTWILDLTSEKAEIIRNFSQGTRTRYNQFSKKGLSVSVSHDLEDIDYLVNLQKQLAKQRNIQTFDKDYLKIELKQPFASLYLVHYQPPNQGTKKVIAASLFFDYKKTRYYMQSAADFNYRKLPATVALLTTALFDAKNQGLKKMDFWGIAPDNAKKDHPWTGFTDFKKSFGGSPVHYAGTWDLILNPTKYYLYELARKVNRLSRKIKSR